MSIAVKEAHPGPMVGLGLVEWLRPGEHERAELLIQDLQRLGIEHVRVGVSWADCYAPGGFEWADWLLPRLANVAQVLPCFCYTPPSLSIDGRAAAPPRDPKAFADFLDVMLTRVGRHFRDVELWNEPNNLNDWDWRLDPGWKIYCEMVGKAAFWTRRRGWRTVLGGMCPLDLNWLRQVAEGGLLEEIDVLGLHGFPGTWDPENGSWTPWEEQVANLREILNLHQLERPVWITECGYSTWRHDEMGQVRRLASALQAPVERVYWYAWQDLDPSLPSQEGLHFDERHYHLGLRDASGRPKLLHRILEEDGADGVARVLALEHPRPPTVGRAHPVLVTGGAGFLGANLVDRLAREGRDVLVLDSLARPGVEHNLDWLRERHPDRVFAEIGDMRDRWLVADAVRDADVVLHLAAQVAVTTSLHDPHHDFETNTAATLHLLDAARRRSDPPLLAFASTNKVYGALADIEMVEHDVAYAPVDETVARHGIDEGRPLDLHSPYGCSKGAADQYVLDHARIYGLPATVFRMSCLYGPRQFGTEDQGWIAHFLASALRDEPITVFGDGKQVRDVLFVDDAVEAWMRALDRPERVAGRVFNLGGGPPNAVSLRLVLQAIQRLVGQSARVCHEDWRPGDQLYYVSDTRRVGAALGWAPEVGWRDGLERLARWMMEEAPGHRGRPGVSGNALA